MGGKRRELDGRVVWGNVYIESVSQIGGERSGGGEEMQRLMFIPRFVPELIKLAREVKNLSSVVPGFTCFFTWLPSRKKRVFILVFQTDVHEYHLLAVKISERLWPIPPSRARELHRSLLKTVEKKLQRYLPFLRNRTLVIVGRFTSGALRRSVSLIKGIASSEMTLLLDPRRVNPVKKIRELLSKLYTRRARGIIEASREKNIEPYGHLETLIHYYTDIARILAPGPPGTPV